MTICQAPDPERLDQAQNTALPRLKCLGDDHPSVITHRDEAAVECRVQIR
jgi:hypothetical protein